MIIAQGAAIAALFLAREISVRARMPASNCV